MPCFRRGRVKGWKSSRRGRGRKGRFEGIIHRRRSKHRTGTSGDSDGRLTSLLLQPRGQSIPSHSVAGTAGSAFSVDDSKGLSAEGAVNTGLEIWRRRWSSNVSFPATPVAPFSFFPFRFGNMNHGHRADFQSPGFASAGRKRPLRAVQRSFRAASGLALA